jgi:hypothetical protein
MTAPSCCAACSQDAKCDFFSYDGTAAESDPVAEEE